MAPVIAIAPGACPGCGGTVRLRKGIVVKYCSPGCGKNHRARANHYGAARALSRKRARLRRVVMDAIAGDTELARDVLRAVRAVAG